MITKIFQVSMCFCSCALSFYSEFSLSFPIIEHVARMEEVRSAFKILTGKPTGNRPLGRPRRRWEDNIRMDLEENGVNAGNWVDTAQDRNYWRVLVNTALNLRVP